jgi:Domain of unknown function (DUF1992)
MAEYHESWIDRQIREAQERGAFDNLKGAGKPLKSINGRDDPEWWVRGLMEREGISHSELLPAGIRLRREIEDLPETLKSAHSERDVRALVADLNDRIRDARKPRPTGPPAFIRTVDADEAVAQWRADRGKKAGPSQDG